jgi:hypothetical protein
MKWEVEYTDEFEEWWNSLDPGEQDSIAVTVGLLEKLGPNLPRPYSDTIKGSKFTNMKELRTQHNGLPYRTLYAFDPRRTAILLIGGNKAGNDNWYKTFVPIADRLFENHLKELEDNG